MQLVCCMTTALNCCKHTMHDTHWKGSFHHHETNETILNSKVHKIKTNTWCLDPWIDFRDKNFQSHSFPRICILIYHRLQTQTRYKYVGVAITVELHNCFHCLTVYQTFSEFQVEGGCDRSFFFVSHALPPNIYTNILRVHTTQILLYNKERALVFMNFSNTKSSLS